mgnify:CR=1 FL=1
MELNNKNYLILKNQENNEEHLGEIYSIYRDLHKIQIKLIDEEKNIFYVKNRDLEVMIPIGTELFCFNTTVLFFDIIEKVITISYPEEISEVIRRKFRRYNLNIALEIELGAHLVPSISYDVSLGGISFLTNSQCVLGDKITLKFKMDPFKNLDVDVRILRRKNFIYRGKYFLFYAGEFINLKKEISDKLEKYLRLEYIN